MNPNWSGRSARTLQECRFWDASATQHFEPRRRFWQDVALWVTAIVALVVVFTIGA